MLDDLLDKKGSFRGKNKMAEFVRNATRIQGNMSDHQIKQMIIEKSINRTSTFISERITEMNKIVDKFSRDQADIQTTKAMLGISDELEKKKETMTV